MAEGTMGVMSEKFGSAAAAYSYLIFVLLYIPCISVMGAIARESSRGWMGFSVLWGLNIAYSLRRCLSDREFCQHPATAWSVSSRCAVQRVVLGLLRRAAVAWMSTCWPAAKPSPPAVKARRATVTKETKHGIVD
jgi:ferrous iron transport protein B